MGKLCIIRLQEFSNRHSRYLIYINGEAIKTIGIGDSKEFDLPEGKHTICCKLDWRGSPELTISVRCDETGTWKYVALKV
jgi:hypothetical protein